MEETKQLGLKWKPSNYFIVGGVAVCLGVIILVMGKLFTSYLFFLAGFIFLLWPISRLLSSKHFFLTTLSVIVFDLIAYYFITRQYANFPSWKNMLLILWSIVLLGGYLFSFRRAPVQKI